MKRIINILVFCCMTCSVWAQEDTRIVDSLRSVFSTQEGREKVLTMIELTWEFYDVSYDDCIDWGERAIKEAQRLGYADLEAKANYALGIQYAYHTDFDLAKQYLQEAYNQFTAISDTKNAFESLWQLATYELTFGNIDTAYQVYEKALPLAEQLGDTSAYAYVLTNMGWVWYKKGMFEKSARCYNDANRLFHVVGDERMLLRTEYQMATVSYEWGYAPKARDLFKKVIPGMEKFQDYYPLIGVCKNLGLIFEKDLLQYDSAMYYLGKAMVYAEMPMEDQTNQVQIINEKSEIIVEMGNVLLKQDCLAEAMEKYEEALTLAKRSAYLYGQMEACLGLGKVYCLVNQPQKSLQYFQQFFELEKASGIALMRPSIRKDLIINYARLGLFDELETELSDFEEDNQALLRENADIYERNRSLQSDAETLLHQYELQNDEIETLQSQRNHYRLAFFGLLAIALFVVVLYVAYKIVRKNQTKK